MCDYAKTRCLFLNVTVAFSLSLKPQPSKGQAESGSQITAKDLGGPGLTPKHTAALLGSDSHSALLTPSPVLPVSMSELYRLLTLGKTQQPSRQALGTGAVVRDEEDTHLPA